MLDKIKHIVYLIPAILLLMLGSCQQEPLEMVDVYPLEIRIDIAGVPSVPTRVERTTTGDQWSYAPGQSFQKDDRIGFYASGGNATDGNDGKAPFINELLVFDGEKFVSEESGAAFSPTFMNDAEILMYYEYSQNIGTTGIQLRTAPPENPDTLRCIDFLTAYNITAIGADDKALYGSLGHEFSELIIMRGEGFDAPPDNKWMINVVMSQPVTHLRITTTEDPWSCTPQLFYDEVTSGLSEDQARRWTAWQGYNYGITENNDPVGEPAWYVIVPSLKSQYATVEFIELYDNDGYLQRVSSLKLDNNTKNVKPGWRYPVKIAMKEMVPTVNPFPILPWGQEVNLTDERTRGIHDASEFANWVKDYNAFLIDQENTTKQNALLNYGDMYTDNSGNISWHFYLLNNIDLSNYQALPYEGKDGQNIQPEDKVIIPQFHDILDGKSSTIVNGQFASYQISNLGMTFIGTMSPWPNANNECAVTNLDFINPDIRYPEENTSAVGIIANSMTDASVVNCDIEKGNLMNANGPAGMIAGSMTGGSLQDCNLEGFIVYKQTASDPLAQKIVGSDPSGASIVNVNAADVAIGQ